MKLAPYEEENFFLRCLSWCPGSKTCVIMVLPSIPPVDVINTYLVEDPGLRQREEGDLGSDP